MDKLLVVVVENHSLDQMRREMPRLAALAKTYGYATAYDAIRHPSLPNYIAMTAGSTRGISDDGPPSSNEFSGPSVFGEAIRAGGTAAVYADGAPGPCALDDTGDYAVKHNPWAYFADERETCGRFDLPLQQLEPALTAGKLPNAGMLVPDLCHDAHDCPLGVADEWVAGWLQRVMAGPDWASGRLAVVVTADEDDHSAGNRVLTVVLHPAVRGVVVQTPLNHYSLARLYAEVTGTPPLAEAAAAPSMAAAFGLPVRQR